MDIVKRLMLVDLTVELGYQTSYQHLVELFSSPMERCAKYYIFSLRICYLSQYGAS